VKSRGQKLLARTGRAVDAVIVGAGHSGLAMSRCLAGRGVDHVVLERGEIANSWRYERWDSLRLLTTNWQARLPGFAYTGTDPDGFMSMPEVIDFIDRYAWTIAAPVRSQTTVRHVRRTDAGYLVITNRGNWRCRAVVIASGAFARPAIPPVAAALPNSITGLASKDYRNPAQIAPGGVLVVGASATGLQLASELSAAGRRVTLAAGEHVRMPRSYRGSDIQWWLTESGVLDQTYTEVDDIERARRVPSPQLVGSAESVTLDLNALQQAGVEIVGRLAGISDTRVQFSGSLRNCCALADLKLGRLLDGFDEWAVVTGLASRLEPPSRPEATRVAGSPRLLIDLAREGIETVIWATGLKPDYEWLELPVFDRRGRIRHDGGVVGDGICVLGLPYLRRRKSSYMHGAEDDARDLSAYLCSYLRGVAPVRARASA
jgi:putative flavoprotein involved in K+ transport